MSQPENGGKVEYSRYGQILARRVEVDIPMLPCGCRFVSTAT